MKPSGALARFLLFDCCACPHEDYMTVSISQHLHECCSCGERFTDTTREKRYWGKGPR